LSLNFGSLVISASFDTGASFLFSANCYGFDCYGLDCYGFDSDILVLSSSFLADFSFADFSLFVDELAFSDF